MDNLNMVVAAIKCFVIMTGTAVSATLGGWDMALKVLVVFVVADYITGLVAAWIEGQLNSRIGFKGIAKKVLLFIPIGIGYWLDQFIGQEILRNLAIFFYLANEGLSTLENLGKAGVPIPSQIRDALEQLENNNKGGTH